MAYRNGPPPQQQQGNMYGAQYAPQMSAYGPGGPQLDISSLSGMNGGGGPMVPSNGGVAVGGGQGMPSYAFSAPDQGGFAQSQGE